MVSTQQGKQWVVTLGRVGMVGFGIVHLVVAWLAVRVAIGGGGGEADQKGALAEVAAQPFGVLMVGVLAVGLAFFAIWQLLVAVNGYGWLHGRGRLTKRVSAAAHAFAGAVLAAVAVQLLIGSRPKQGDATQQELTGWVLSLPGGQFLMGLVALGVIAVGSAAVVKGLRKSFTDDLDLSRLPEGTKQPTIRLGQAGYIAKGIAYGVVGVLMGIAAIDHDPKQAGGLDAALRTLAEAPYGPYLLVAVGFGVACFGVYCLAEARCHRS
ncbi:hypothetical protein JOF53_004583 [Crossiella equi]|uniref:DUF1206 domain-containing protein n=1 Tax=Crossiella equi TaxID=130796 RepID=A0ABS5AGK7_9PSEU|nr:DUF1206 domain-containing protein [Crossiella equi]MBP2475711.1 hypothetical protein [Crossiella equi]